MKVGSGVKPKNYNCPACGAEAHVSIGTHLTSDSYRGYGLVDHEVVTKLEALHTVDRYEILKCLSCGLESSYPLQAPSADWYGTLYNNLSLYPEARWEYGFILRNAKRNSSICDLGCGSGEFLRHAISAGFKPTGFDFFAEAVANGRASGLEVCHLAIDNLPNVEFQKYDTVVSFQVLEHLELPSALFKAAQSLGTEDCKFWLSVPSDIRPSRIYSEIDYLDLPPHHMTHWTEISLKALGERQGWFMSAFFYEPISFKQKVWNKTVRSKSYKFLGLATQKNKWFDRFVRTLFFVPAGLSILLSGEKTSGFSMLALFERGVDV